MSVVGVGLALRGVSHRYGPRLPAVLRDVTLAVEPDVSLALMGPSGSGKTTLLCILGLLLAPSDGDLWFDGQRLSLHGRERTRLRRECFGWVFQSVNVLPHRTALDNAALGLLARGVGIDEARQAAAEALNAVAIGPLATRPVHALSGGELQRVCIARALAARPRFILADEPTGQLDRANTKGVIEALVQNRPAGTSVVIATHDPLVASHCDRIIQMVDGTPALGHVP